MQRDEIGALAVSSDTTGEAQAPDTRLRGTWLFVARTVWVTLFALNLVWFGMALVSQATAIEHPCTDPLCIVTPVQAETLRHMEIGLGTLAAYFVGIPALLVLAGSVITALLFWRRPDDWLALTVGIFLVVYPVTTFALIPGPQAIPVLGLLLEVPDAFIYFGVFLIFPDGRFVPRWVWLLLVVWAAWQWAEVIATVLGIPAPGRLDFFAYPVLYLSALATQVYRFRSVSNARQRQQTKWVILGFIVVLLANITFWNLLPSLVPTFQRPGTFYYAVAFPLYELATIALPVSFALAIQRHQLFDVDVLIKRTLVYGTLTVILAALYFGVVVGAQAAVGTVDPQASQSPVIVVATTLLIIVLFTPLRRSLQAIIDRRFYRSKYDAARTLEAFGATLRTETDLSELSDQLVAVVRETMQPASVSLWLAAPARPGGYSPERENDNEN